MIKADRYFKENLYDIIRHGTFDSDPRPKWKDGTPAHSKFITQVFEKYHIDRNEYPITTLRNTAIKKGIAEILWIYQKQSNDLTLARDMGIDWWNEWDIGDNTIGHRYGHTVERYLLIENLLDGLKYRPFDRGHIINLYQYSELESSKGLRPCAYETLFSVRKSGPDTYLDMTLIQRSNDFVTAGYINKVQYLAFLMMIAKHCGYKVGTFAHFVQNLHIYDRHVPAASEILEREPLKRDGLDVIPKIRLNTSKSNFYDFTVNDFELIDCKVPKIKSKLEIAV